MGGSGLVEAEVRLQCARDHLVRHEVMEHQDVRLLDDLRSLYPFGPEQQVGGDRPARRDVLDDQCFEACEPGELLVDPGVGVVAVYQGVGERAPCECFVARDVVGAGRGGDRVGGAPQVPARHHVREGVVVDRFVVLVGPDHAVDVCAVGFATRP